MSDVVWQKVPGLPARYEASSAGGFRTLDYETPARRGGIHLGGSKRIKGREIKSYLRQGGHPTVSVAGRMTHGAKMGQARLALLVCRAFHGSPYPLADKGKASEWRIRHLDGNLENCAADNLKWVGNAGAIKPEEVARYESNLREIARRATEMPISEWAKIVFGDETDEAA